MTIEPPSETGAVHATSEALLAPPAAVTLVGTPGTASGMAGLDAAEAIPVPAPFVALTVNV